MRHPLLLLMAASVGLLACSGSAQLVNTLDDGGTIGGGDDDGAPGTGAFFPAGSWFYDDVSGRAPAAGSDAIIASLRAAGGWGNGDRMQIDFSLEVLAADGAAKQSFPPTEDFGLPDCDPVAV